MDSELAPLQVLIKQTLALYQLHIYNGVDIHDAVVKSNEARNFAKRHGLDLTFDHGCPKLVTKDDRDITVSLLHYDFGTEVNVEPGFLAGRSATIILDALQEECKRLSKSGCVDPFDSRNVIIAVALRNLADNYMPRGKRFVQEAAKLRKI